MPTYAQQKAWADKAGLKSFSIYLPAEDLRRLDELADARGPDGKRMGRREAIGKLLDGYGGAEELIRIQEETIAL
jgi:predicted transcriptional regulator